MCVRKTARLHENAAVTVCAHIHSCAHTHISLHTNFRRANISLHSWTKWGNRSKLFAYKLMKYYWVKLSWMLITKVMHYLLINESSLWARDGTGESMISVGTQTVIPINVAYSRCVENILPGSKISMQVVEGKKRKKNWSIKNKGAENSRVGNPFGEHGHKRLSYRSGWNENELLI